MAYVIITTRPKELKGTFDKYSVLSKAQWCTEGGGLSTLSAALAGEFSFYFIDFDSQDFFIEQLTQIKKQQEFKLIYFCQEFEGQILKDHQGSTVGGDAYLPFDISPADFDQMLLALTPQDMNTKGNRLENNNQNILKKYDLQNLSTLDEWKKSYGSQSLDEIFESVIVPKSKIKFQSVSSFASVPDEEPIIDEVNLSEGDDMSDKDQELDLDDLGDLELGADIVASEETVEDDGGFDLSLDDSEELDLSAEGEVVESAQMDSDDEFSLGDTGGDDFSLSEDGDDLAVSDLSDDGDDQFSLGDDDLSLSDDLSVDDDLSLGDEVGTDDDILDLGGDDLSLGDTSPELSADSLGEDDSLDFSLGGEDEAPEVTPEPELDAGLDLGLGLGDDLSFSMDEEVAPDSGDLSDDAMAKLKEIDEMMGDPADESLVSDDIDLGQIDLSSSDDDMFASPEPEVKKPAKKKKEAEVQEAAPERSLNQDIKEIVGNYSGEMERLAATLSNLRVDREELLNKIQKLEEEKLLQHRQNLSLRAELDEKKIELTIIKKKLNEENNELKDKVKIHEEMKMILEEKNKALQIEVEKVSQKTRLDVRKVQGRERELEQKLELLKIDAETQIRHRDQKILELKRRVDGMEFDMESMGHQEKKSLEGKVELEQKLDKAIRTLKGAITILENDSEAARVLEKLKKNIEV